MNEWIARDLTQTLSGRFTQDLENFMLSRLENFRPRDISEKYDEEMNSHAALYDEIKKMLPAAGHEILERLSESSNVLEAVTEELAYKQGFSDGIRFIIQSLSGGY